MYAMDVHVEYRRRTRGFYAYLSETFCGLGPLRLIDGLAVRIWANDHLESAPPSTGPHLTPHYAAGVPADTHNDYKHMAANAIPHIPQLSVMVGRSLYNDFMAGGAFNPLYDGFPFSPPKRPKYDPKARRARLPKIVPEHPAIYPYDAVGSNCRPFSPVGVYGWTTSSAPVSSVKGALYNHAESPAGTKAAARADAINAVRFARCDDFTRTAFPPIPSPRLAPYPLSNMAEELSSPPRARLSRKIHNYRLHRTDIGSYATRNGDEPYVDVHPSYHGIVVGVPSVDTDVLATHRGGAVVGRGVLLSAADILAALPGTSTALPGTAAAPSAATTPTTVSG
jgi:hypothetical protein